MDSQSGLRPPDPPLRTREQAGSASLTVTHIPIELIFFATPNPLPPSVSWGCFSTHCPDVECQLDVIMATRFCKIQGEDR